MLCGIDFAFVAQKLNLMKLIISLENALKMRFKKPNPGVGIFPEAGF
jgi:hypothetical protein